MKAYRFYVMYYVLSKLEDKVNRDPKVLSDILYLVNLALQKHEKTLGYRFTQRQYYVGITDEDMPYDIDLLEQLGLIQRSSPLKVIREPPNNKEDIIRTLKNIYGEKALEDIDRVCDKLKQVQTNIIPYLSIFAFIISRSTLLNDTSDDLLRVFESSMKIKHDLLKTSLDILKDMPFDENILDKTRDLLAKL